MPRNPLLYARSHRPQFLEELKEFVRFPTISAQPQHSADLKRCATWLATHLRQIGLPQVRVFPTRRHPIVYAASWNVPGLPTVLIYGHYDVQPPDPLEEWHSPPFQPIVRGDDLYGRGACDDKGQMFAHVKGLESHLRTAGKLPVNVKCLFEGEEEIGSPNLFSFLTRNRPTLRSDVAVLSDMPILSPNRPAITYSMRGGLGLELEVEGPKRDLHSGIFGGAVHNPLQALCEIIAKLHGGSGRVSIPGFYDRVRNVSETERSYLARTGPSDAELLKDAGVLHAWGEPGYSLYERTATRPALTINGITGGYQGAGTKGVIPARASAKISFRLVADQDPKEIDRAFREHLARITPPTVRLKVHTLSAARSARANPRHPAMLAAARAYRKGFGASPLFLRSGGTIPVVNQFQRVLDIPTVLMGFALPDDRMHGPNEKFHLPNFYRGIETSIWFLHEIASGHWGRPSSQVSESGCSIW